MTFNITRNDISPAITRLLRLARNPRPVLRAMGQTFMTITTGNFNGEGAAFRPMPWKAKFDGSPGNLQQSTTLARSFFLKVDDKTATVGNLTPYAAIHQFGGTILPKGKALVFPGAGGKTVFAKKVVMPARPFFPVLNDRLTPAAEAMIVAAGERAIARAAAGAAGN